MKSRNIIIFLSIIIVLGASFFLYQERSNVRAELNYLKLTPQPEHFTELYFENSSNLPRATVAGHAISFSFGIHNVESMMKTYPYEVYFDSTGGGRIDISTGAVILQNNASTTVTISYTFQTSNAKGRVVVNLPSEDNQSIDFLLPNNN